MQYLSNNAVKRLQEILPAGWSAQFYPGERRHFDGWLDVVPPSGPPCRFEAELKERFEPHDIDRIERLKSGLPADGKVLVVAPYLSPRSRELLKQRGISYADLTGNLWLSADSFFIDRTGAQKSPTRNAEARPRTSLRGPITGRIVRFLCDTPPPLKVREIALETNVHAGNISRILEFLEREHFVERSARGLVEAVDWESLLARWSQDLQKERRSETVLEPHGIEVAIRRLLDGDLPYAITGSYAAAQLAPATAPIAIDVYVRDIDEGRDALLLRPSDRIGNVRLIQTYDRVAFERTMNRDNVILACPSQIAADLLTLPKRSSDEFSALIDWMKRNERDWRVRR